MRRPNVLHVTSHVYTQLPCKTSACGHQHGFEVPSSGLLSGFFGTFPYRQFAICIDYNTRLSKNGRSTHERCCFASSACRQAPLAVRSIIGNAVEDDGRNVGRKELWQDTVDRLSQLDDEVTAYAAYVSLLRSCGISTALSKGMCIHDHIVQSSLVLDISFNGFLVEMYALCTALEDAMALFVSMCQHEVYLWNCVIRAHAQQGRADDAFLLFEKMKLEGIKPDNCTLIAVLAACANHEACKRMHVLVQHRGLEQNVFIATALLTMYGKCCRPESAWTVFEKMHERDGVAWSAMIAVHAQHDQGKQALELFEQMQEEGVRPSEATFVSVFDSCASSPDLIESQVMHAYMLDCGMKPDTILGNAIVNMYSKCGSLEDACVIFDQMVQKDIGSWNAMIGAYAQHGEAKEALLLVDQLRREAIIPSRVSFVCILDACASAAALFEGKQMHDHAIDAGQESHVVVETAILNMYGKCGSLEDAQRMFDRISEPSVVSCTAMIGAFTQHGKGKEAIGLFEQMQQEGIFPNRVTVICALDACARQMMLVKGKHVHACIVNSAFESDSILANALINMYGKCGSVANAQNMFDEMPRHDVVSWTAMIGIYAQHGQTKQAVQLFNKMQQEGAVANKVTLICVLDSCAGSGMLAEGRYLHTDISRNGFELDSEVTVALLQLYGKCSSLADAQRIFDIAYEQDIALWTALIGACNQNGVGGEAVHLLEEMQQQGVMPNNVTFVSILDAFVSQTTLMEGKRMHARITQSGYVSDISVGNALVNMYGKCNSLEDAWNTFDKMPERDVVSWTAMIAVYAQHWMGNKALQLFDQMESTGTQPNKVTFVCILDACANCAALARGEQMHDRIKENGFESDVVVSTALINMYGKCGNVEYARDVFDRMSEKNTFAWSAMIAVYSEHGKAMEALQLFEGMQREQVRPDDVTIISVLTACSHAGLINVACHFFTSLIQDGSVTPTVDHYSCMIDLLGRSGLLEEAELLVHNIPGSLTVPSLMTLLGACRYQADVKRGERTAASMFGLDPSNPAPYVMLSNIYAAAGREDDVILISTRAKEFTEPCQELLN